MALVFQYGSNIHPDRLNTDERLRGDARLVCAAHTVEPYEMEFSTWSEGNSCAAANIVPGSGHQIWGSIFEVPDELMSRETVVGRKSMDGIEGKNYRRIRVQVQRRETEVIEEVTTYVVVTRSKNIRTSGEYSGHIINGLTFIQAPADYVEYVKTRVTTNNPELLVPN